MSCFNNISDSMDMSLSKLWEIVKTGKPGMLQSMSRKGLDMNLNKLWETVEDRGARHTTVHGVVESLDMT